MSVTLTSQDKIIIRQRKELAELIGFETRNKYSIELLDGSQIAFAGEDGKTLGSFFGRQFLGHWRPFKIQITGHDRKPFLTIVHPFNFIFQRFEIIGVDGRKMGEVKQRFSLIRKKFDLHDASGTVVMTSSTPIWKPWTFTIVKNDVEVAQVLKKWSGLLKEAFTDGDNFLVEFKSKNLNEKDRAIILATALLIDIVYFEQKAN